MNNPEGRTEFNSPYDSIPLCDVLDGAIDAAVASTHAVWAMWSSLTDDQRGDWLQYMEAVTPPRGLFLKTLLPVADRLGADWDQHDAECDARGRARAREESDE